MLSRGGRVPSGVSPKASSMLLDSQITLTLMELKITYPVSASLRKGLAARARLVRVAKMMDFIVKFRARKTSRYKCSAVE
jgi:hypothetical protein